MARFLFPVVILLIASTAFAQENLSAKGKQTYDQIKSFTLTGGTAGATGLVLKRDRVEMTFDGAFYFASPVVIFFSGDQHARGTVHAYGPKTPFQIKLPMKPKKIELDPHNWILSEKTETKGK
jgi:hypothetical protein